MDPTGYLIVGHKSDDDGVPGLVMVDIALGRSTVIDSADEYGDGWYTAVSDDASVIATIKWDEVVWNDGILDLPIDLIDVATVTSRRVHIPDENFAAFSSDLSKVATGTLWGDSPGYSITDMATGVTTPTGLEPMDGFELIDWSPSLNLAVFERPASLPERTSRVVNVQTGSIVHEITYAAKGYRSDPEFIDESHLLLNRAFEPGEEIPDGSTGGALVVDLDGPSTLALDQPTNHYSVTAASPDGSRWLSRTLGATYLNVPPAAPVLVAESPVDANAALNVVVYGYSPVEIACI